MRKWKRRVKIRHLTEIFITAAAVLAFASCAPEKKVSAQSFVFDTYAQFTVSGIGAKEALKDISESFEDMNGAFELCYGTDALSLPENEIYKSCLEKANVLSERYGNGVNVTCGALTELWGISTPEPKVPVDNDIQTALNTIVYGTENLLPGTRLDFGSVAKGYACDEAYSILQDTNTDYAVINLSSTTLMYGEKPGGEKFRAGITDPLTGKGYMGIIETDAAFISTSGGYERYFEADGIRYCHILDIKTGRPVETDLSSVTVIVPAETPDGGIMSDFLSTLIFTEGTENIGKWLAYEEFEVVAADVNGKIYTDCGGFIPDEGSGYKYE